LTALRRIEESLDDLRRISGVLCEAHGFILAQLVARRQVKKDLNVAV